MAGADKLVKQLEALAIEVREKIGQQALTAGMAPVQAAVSANTPQSSNTRSREKQSSKTKKKWSGSKKLKDTIRSVVRTRRKAGITAGLIGLVGPSYSEGGGHGNLFSKDHKRKVLWGRDAGSTRSVNQFVKRAADQSSSQAASAVVSALKSGIDQAAARSSNG
jgi:HK97 gp10 family phage protein